MSDGDIYPKARDRSKASLMLKCMLQSALSIYVLVFPLCLFISFLSWIPIGPDPEKATTSLGFYALALARVFILTFWFIARFCYVTLPVIWLNAVFIAKRRRAEAARQKQKSTGLD
ncbi:MAG: hypothetical protein QOD03_41 [Verrucomicrobiota bacterium]